MSDSIMHIRSVSEGHQLLGLDSPKHPLITILSESQLRIPKEMVGVRMMTDLYYIALKGSNCGMQYGRNQYDFDGGVLVFTAPGQVVAITEEIEENSGSGWMLFFHPDLVRSSSLGENIDRYSFFNYEVYEALHLSDSEEQILTDCAFMIRNEYEQRIDNHSQNVIVSTLELMLNYSLRFYERQFNTRTNHHKDVVTQFENNLKAYFNSNLLLDQGAPTIQYFADQIHLSQNYLSDLLKKETGRSAKDHINDFIVEKAKNVLLNSDHSVSEIAFNLGFNYPHYFSRLFKAKTGYTPQEYRTLN